MFKHGRTGQTYYSVREKIKYYSGILNGKTSATVELKAKAKRRLPELQEINERSYNEPTMIVTDDKHFGNGISKPRAAVVYGVDSKKRLLVSPIVDRNVKSVILENDTSRQVDSRTRVIDRNDVYETKYISGLATLTDSDKKRIKAIKNKK